MNAWGREVLIRAALDGVPQSYALMKEERWDGTIAYCARGLLQEAIHDKCGDGDGAAAMNRLLLDYYPDERCPECGLQFKRGAEEFQLAVHYNDDHRFDFLTIAQKMPVTPNDDGQRADDPWPAPPMPLLFTLLVEQDERRSQEPRQVSFDFGV
jgi:hypothetical protein